MRYKYLIDYAAKSYTHLLRITWKQSSIGFYFYFLIFQLEIYFRLKSTSEGFIAQLILEKNTFLMFTTYYDNNLECF